MNEAVEAPPLSTCKVLEGSVDELLSREWLLTNQRGAFVSGTVIGCPTRRYHGLLVAPKAPPLERYLLLAGMLEKVTLGGTTVTFSTFEFPGTLHPDGYEHLKDFTSDTAAANPWVRFTYAHGSIEFSRQITLCRDADVVRISYRVTGVDGQELQVEISPFLAMRDSHSLRHQAAEDSWTVAQSDSGLWVQDRFPPEISLFLFPSKGEGLTTTKLELSPMWWHDFRYRVDLSRGLPGGEDLYCAGTFRAQGTGEMAIDLVAVAFPESPAAARATVERSPALVSQKRRAEWKGKDHPIRDRLVAAADQFVVRRGTGPQAHSTTIIAGYPWFGDWGRDSLVSLEGLLLVTGRFDEAKEVLATFASRQRNGLIPNLFGDHGGECAYNSVDASLWFIHAADAYVRHSGDTGAWSALLADPCHNVAEAFVRGTDFGIVVDDRGLLRCGDPSTQVTWMDAKVNGMPVTPRHGFPVEVNALWYSGLSVLLRREEEADGKRAKELSDLVNKIRQHFEPAFFNAHDNCLYDCLGHNGPDAAVRPNQIFAVSLPHSPLSVEKQKAVVEKVHEHLLTPYGLRSLSPADSRYCGRHEGDQRQQDRAYHNGTVWAWLIGPFVEAFLRVNDFSPEAKVRGRELLAPLLEHLSHACLGQISEIFDGDPPHHPRGCFAQAWSVAEVLRMYDATSTGDKVSG